MPFREELPTYPVINQSPTVGAMFRNWGGAEYSKVFFHTLGGMVIGFACGAPLRRHGSYFLGSVGFVAGVYFSMQQSGFRLRGTLPNQAECRRAGIEFVDPYAPGGAAYPRATPATGVPQ